jgi:hypothetical protein
VSGGLAARVAGWTRRVGSLAGPLGAVSAGSGDSPSGAPLQVELYVGGLWVDITSYVMTRDGSQNVSIRRGQPNEAASTDPATCDFQLNNRDGRFSPRNPNGPYYGQLGRNQPLRVSVPSGNDKSYRFWGEVSAWPQDWDTTGTDVWVDVQAAGLLRRLGQGSSPVGSTMYLAGISPSRAATTAAYWPCEDATRAQLVASAIGGPAMAIAGTPTMASYSQFECSSPLPVMGDASFVGSVPAYTDSGAVTVLFLLGVPSTGATDGQVLCSFTTTGTARKWEAYYATIDGGNVGLRAYDSAGTLVVDTGASFLAEPLNGRPVQIALELLQEGANISVSALVQGVGEGGQSGVSGTVVGSTFGIITSITMAPQRGLTDTALGHVIVLAEYLPSFSLDLDAYAGEQAGRRIERLTALFGISFESVGSLTGFAYMGSQLSSTALALLQETVTADLGILYEQTGGLGLGYRTRISMQNQTPALALSYSANQLSEIPRPLDDDQYTRNDVTVTRTGGSSARSTLASGPLSVLEPPAGVGRYDDAVTINVELDIDLPDQAGWRRHLGTVDEARYPQISVNLAHPTFTTNPSLRRQVLAVRPGDRIVITDPPTSMAPDGISQLVLGFAETIDRFQHRVTFNCAPESPHRVAVADDATYGRADTAGSALAADVTATETAFSVATTSGPTWVTTLSESPFDLRVGGEVVTVAAVGTLLNSNPFFTADLSGWTDVSQNSTISRSTDVVHSARGAVASMLIVPNGLGASGGGASTPLTAVGTVTAGASYRASLWAYSPGGWSDLRPAVDWYDAAGAFISSSLGSGTAVAAGAWTYIEQTFTAPALASRAVMRARHGGTPSVSDVWYVWAVRLVAVASVVSTSPQGMTVIRSVNGVVKAQVAGEDVRLNQPAIAAL